MKEKLDRGREKIQKEVTYAGFWIRLSAFIIDTAIILVLGVIASFILEVVIEAIGIHELNATVENLFGTFIIWVYYIYLTYTYNSTFGKKIFNIEVVSSKGGELRLGQVILRETIGKIISFFVFGIGFISIGITKEKQGFHDKIGKTNVLRQKSFSKKQKIIHKATLFFAALMIAVVIFGGITWLFRMNSLKNEARKAYAEVTVFQMAVLANNCQSQGGEILPPASSIGGGNICSVDLGLEWPNVTNGFSYENVSAESVSLISEDSVIIMCWVKDLQCNFE